MPNWCKNELRVLSLDEGGHKQLADFLAKAKGDGTDLSLEKFVPTPPELLEDNGNYDSGRKDSNVCKYGAPDWNVWRMIHWGTKWDVEARLCYADAGMAEFEFDSAWAPPVCWLEAVSSMYPDLEFRLYFREDDMEFMGVAFAEEGVLKTNEVLSYGVQWTLDSAETRKQKGISCEQEIQRIIGVAHAKYPESKGLTDRMIVNVLYHALRDFETSIGETFAEMAKDNGI